MLAARHFDEPCGSWIPPTDFADELVLRFGGDKPVIFRLEQKQRNPDLLPGGMHQMAVKLLGAPGPLVSAAGVLEKGLCPADLLLVVKARPGSGAA